MNEHDKPPAEAGDPGLTPTEPSVVLPAALPRETELTPMSAAAKVRRAAQLAQECGEMGGTTKPAGVEPQPPKSLPVQAVVGMLHQLLQNLGDTVDRCDSHFMQHPLLVCGVDGPPYLRTLTEEEVLLLAKRRHAVVVIKQIRDSALVLLDACGPGPRPFA